MALTSDDHKWLDTKFAALYEALSEHADTSETKRVTCRGQVDAATTNLSGRVATLEERSKMNRAILAGIVTTGVTVSLTIVVLVLG